MEDADEDCLPPDFTLLVTGQIESADLPPAATVSASLLPWPLPGLSAARFGGGRARGGISGGGDGSGRGGNAPPLPAASSARCPAGSAYCRFEIVAGEDWALVDGQDGGITQLARPALAAVFGGGAFFGGRNGNSGSISGGIVDDPSPSGGRPVLWNHPLEAVFRASSAFGWPQIAVAVYGVCPATGRDVPRGYGAAHLPTGPAGRHRLRVRLFRPRASSSAGWWAGAPAEFADARTPSYSEGRDVTRVLSGGHVDVQVDVATRNMAAFGYDNGGGR